MLIKRLFSHIPTSLPVGYTHYNAWLNEIVELTGSIADVDSINWVISNEVMRLSSTKDRVPKAYFVKVLRKFAANQLAAAKVNEIKDNQKAAQEAAKQAEVTAAQEASVNVSAN